MILSSYKYFRFNVSILNFVLIFFIAIFWFSHNTAIVLEDTWSAACKASFIIIIIRNEAKVCFASLCLNTHCRASETRQKQCLVRLTTWTPIAVGETWPLRLSSDLCCGMHTPTFTHRHCEHGSQGLGRWLRGGKSTCCMRAVGIPGPWNSRAIAHTPVILIFLSGDERQRQENSWKLTSLAPAAGKQQRCCLPGEQGQHLRLSSGLGMWPHVWSCVQI